MRDGPPRRAGPKAKARLQGQIINLVNHAVDIVAQSCALGFDASIVIQHRIRAVAQHGHRVGLKAKVAHPGDGARLRFCQRVGQSTPGIGKKPQRARCGNTGIQLAQRPCGSVAGVGKGFLTIAKPACVEGGKIGVAHVNFAANIHQGRDIITLQLVRNIGDGAGVFGDVFAHLTVTPCGGLGQAAIHIAQAKRQTVDFGFSGVGNRSGQAQKFAHPVVKIGDVGGIESVFQTEHPHIMADLTEPIRRRAAHFVGWAVFPLQARKPRLYLSIPAF